VSATRFARLASSNARLAAGATTTAVLLALGACAASPSGTRGSVIGAAGVPSPAPSVSDQAVAASASISPASSSADSTAGLPADSAGSAVGSPAPISAPPVAFTVQDPATGNHFEVVLTPGDPSFGQFIAAIPGVGLVAPNAAATVTINANHTDTLAYRGAGGLGRVSDVERG